MSMTSAQIDELRNAAEFYDGFKAANLMRDAADTIWELRGALQVASVDYRHLEAENAKLQDENARLRSCLSDDVDNARQIMGENARLREFASEAWELLTCNEPNFVWSGLQKKARELGIEVEP